MYPRSNNLIILVTVTYTRQRNTALTKTESLEKAKHCQINSRKTDHKLSHI